MNAMTTIQTPTRPIHPVAILAAPSEVYRLTQTFFAIYAEEDKPPTPASLAIYLGFSSRNQMMKVFEDAHKYPEESVHYVAQALSKIEAELGEKGLMDKVNVTMAKYLMSATLGVVEKKEVIGDGNKININILGVTDKMPEVQQSPSNLTADDL